MLSRNLPSDIRCHGRQNSRPPRVWRKGGARWRRWPMWSDPGTSPGPASSPPGQARGHPAKSRQRGQMAVRSERSGSVWTAIHGRPEASNAMDAASAEALTAAFEQFDKDDNANVAVFWGEGGAFCAGWDLKSVSSLDETDPVGALDFPKDGGTAPRGPLGPSRLEMSKP